MAKQVMAIKMRSKKGKRKDGKIGFIYPDFDAIVPKEKRGGVRWQEWISDQEHCAGQIVNEKTKADPDGFENVILVDVPFGEAVKAQLPSGVEIIDEAEFAAFYNDSNAGAASYRTDEGIIVALQTIYETQIFDEKVKQKMSAEDLAAIDPDNDAPGIRRNKLKTFTGFKAAKDIEIVGG